MNLNHVKPVLLSAALAAALAAGTSLIGTLAVSGARGPAATGAPARQNAKVAHTTLKIGDMAPDFTLLDNHWKQVHLADYRGKKNVVLAFYVLAFTQG